MQRKTLFKKVLITDLTKTCYVVLLFKFFLFADSTLVLIVRLVATRMIKEFYPKAREGMAEFVRTGTSTGRNASPSFRLGLPGVNLSGSLTGNAERANDNENDAQSGTSQRNNNELSTAQQQQLMNEKFVVPLSTFLFHVTVTLNVLIIIYRLVFPIDFTAFNEKKRFTLMIDLLSEYHDFSTYNNFTSNLFNIFLEILILLIQFSVLQMTCIDDPKDEVDEGEPLQIESQHNEDGFDGRVHVASINIAESFEKLRARIRIASS